MSGFFDELERQLIEVARSGHPARRGTAPVAWRGALPGRGRALRMRRAWPLPAFAVALVVVAVAVAATLRVGQGSAPEVARTPSHRASSTKAAHDAGQLRGAHGIAWLRDAEEILRAVTPARDGRRPTISVADLSGLAEILRRRSGAGGAEMSDIAWQGRSCSGCYLLDGAALRNDAPLYALVRWAIGMHVGGGNLKRICVWLLSRDGRAEEGSSCSTESALSLARLASREDAAVLTQGFASNGEDITLAGGT